MLVVVLFLLGVLGVPDAALEDNRWGDVENQNVEVITEVGIDNPNPFGFGGSADVAYDIALQGVKLAEGEGAGLNVESGQSSENLPPWWNSHLNNGEQSRLTNPPTTPASSSPRWSSPGNWPSK